MFGLENIVSVDNNDEQFEFDDQLDFPEVELVAGSTVTIGSYTIQTIRFLRDTPHSVLWQQHLQFVTSRRCPFESDNWTRHF